MPDFQAMVRRSGDALRATATWGPGLLVMLADCDAGNVVTAAQSGARWGIGLLPVLLALIPLLYMIQEFTVRLGIFNGRGFGELVRKRFGGVWASIAAAGLVVAAMGSLVTEFTGVAGVGEMYGIPRHVSLSLAVGVLLAVVLTGSHRRVDRVAVFIGMFELAFFAVVWQARPDFDALARQFQSLPFHRAEFSYLAAALIGATFNPWMIFYQQAAIADKELASSDYRAARIETAIGSALTQLLTAAVLVAIAATLSNASAAHGFQSVGEISGALSRAVGPQTGRLLFGVGVLGASLVAAIVCSLALAWGLGEVAGYRRSLEGSPSNAPWFFGVYAAALIVSALIVELDSNLVALNIGAQVVNALMLPLVAGLLIALSAAALPRAQRSGRWYLWLVSILVAIASVAGFVGAAAGWLF
jgi:Mn2+/Fe2+ NRAMP family transporter